MEESQYEAGGLFESSVRYNTGKLAWVEAGVSPSVVFKVETRTVTPLTREQHG